ncbi:alpha/beta hydrolase [Corallococcus sp. H22C18031201]|nr:alpha/beta hydrolase [Corallococcus sp. H22C18031201]
MNSTWVLDEPQPPPDARIAYGEGPHRFGELRLPAGPGPHPVVVFVHGGFWRAMYGLEHAGHLCADLTRRGFATWSLEFRRVGHAGGGYPGTLEDVAAGLDHLRVMAPSRGLDLSRVVVMGHSAGGQLAMWLAARSRLQPGQPLYAAAPLRFRGVVSLAGVVDLEQGVARRLGDGAVAAFVGEGAPDLAARYAVASPAMLQPLPVPQVLVHGTVDDTVPVEMSDAFHTRGRALGAPITYVRLEGTGHYELIDPRSQEWPRVMEALQSLL